MLAEHGSLGAVGLFLFVTPLVLYLEKISLICTFYVLLPFGFTINHAAMRTAIPAFVSFVITLNVQLVPRVPQKRNHYRLVEPTVNN
jgi:hypothetical protein